MEDPLAPSERHSSSLAKIQNSWFSSRNQISLGLERERPVDCVCTGAFWGNTLRTGGLEKDHSPPSGGPGL